MTRDFQAYPYYGHSQGRASGRQRALCIGINAYPSSPLNGCVSDARLWNDWFQSTGFSTEPMLLDQAATRDGILNAVRQLVRQSRAGDVLAIQYSGHGTQLPDLDGDESAGDTPNFDEALVPVDHRQNGYVIDDDLAEVCGVIPDGVNVTFFMDCCHSGTNTRMLLGHVPAPSTDAKKRFLPADQQMIEAHRRTRQRARGGAPRTYRAAHQREILFSACRSDQVAWESNGQGDFTRHALAVLKPGTAGVSNSDFADRVTSLFGANPRQNSQLWCDDRYRDQGLLNPVSAPDDQTDTDISDSTEELRELLRRLRELLNRFQI